MSYADERRLVQGQLQLNMQQVYPAVQIEWEGIEFKRPNSPQPYISPTLITLGESRQITLGLKGRRVRRVAILQVNIYTPQGAGPLQTDNMCDVISSWFVNDMLSADRLTHIMFRPSYTKTVGSRDGYFITALSIPYRVDFTLDALEGTIDMSLGLRQLDLSNLVDGNTSTFFVPGASSVSSAVVFVNGVLQAITVDYTAVYTNNEGETQYGVQVTFPAPLLANTKLIFMYA